MITCRTIPELFYYMLEHNDTGNGRCIMMRKNGNKFEGITYPQLKEETEAFALGLAALGIKKDDKIAIISENRPEWVYADFGILGLGAIDVPLYPSLTADSVEFILNNSESKAVIVSNKLQLNKVLKIKHNCRGLKYIIIMNEKEIIQNEDKLYSFKDIQNMGRVYAKNHPDYFYKCTRKVYENDICTIIYTSGTTGEPKGVLLSHKNILSNVRSALESLPINRNDKFLSFLPLCHIFERMAGYYTAFSSGGIIYYSESIEAVSQNMLEVKPTIITTVPRLFERIYSKIMKNVESLPPVKQKLFYWAVETGKEYAQSKRMGKSSITLASKFKLADKLVLKNIREKTGGELRFLISGGAALPRELGEFFEALGILILEGYGLTESSPVIAVNRVDSYKFGTVGKVFPGVDVKIAPDGEILVKGPNVMQGYFKNRRETNDTIKDGWLHTGDLGVFDSDGFLMITDRKKHLFKTSTGKYIAPTPIENLFVSSKYIDQFVLIGDRRMYLSALIVPDFEALREYADSNNIRYETNADLVRKSEIYQLMEKEMSQFQKKLANYERVRKFTLLDKPFTLETGEITPSLKVKRKFVEERFGNLIDNMYQ